MRINIERLMNDIKAYSEYGKLSSNGITRPSFSEPDYKLRKRFIKDLQEMELVVSVDPIANIWGKNLPKSKKPSICLGSHLDTVTNGGAYDGSLGVLAAKEVIRTLIDYNIKLNHPIEIVSFTAEETNDFNLSTLGSRAFSGMLDQNALLNATDSTGRTLEEAVKHAGSDIHQKFKTKNLAAFIELHIEQGKKLEAGDLPIGIVENIVGIHQSKITVNGEANHTGTTMMTDRADALVAASHMITSIENILLKQNTEAVASVGKINVLPNSANVIPGQVEFILEIRSASKEERTTLYNKIMKEIEYISSKRNVEVALQEIMDKPECNFDQDIMNTLEKTANEMKIPYTFLSSMAGHDSKHMASLTKTAMLFVRSVNGISHSPDEFTRTEDIEVATNLLLQTILELDQIL